MYGDVLELIFWYLSFFWSQKREAPAGEKPEPVRTHLRNMIIVPEMIGSIIGVYNGKTFNQVEIKPEMIGHYLAEFSISYKPVKHGRPGIGATHSSRFIPLKWEPFLGNFSLVCSVLKRNQLLSEILFGGPYWFQLPIYVLSYCYHDLIP